MYLLPTDNSRCTLVATFLQHTDNKEFIVTLSFRKKDELSLFVKELRTTATTEEMKKNLEEFHNNVEPTYKYQANVSKNFATDVEVYNYLVTLFQNNKDYQYVCYHFLFNLFNY
jgi:RNA binding exosome subunit